MIETAHANCRGGVEGMVGPGGSGEHQAASRTSGLPPTAASLNTIPASASLNGATVTGLAFMRLNPSIRVIVSTDTPDRSASWRGSG